MICQPAQDRNELRAQYWNHQRQQLHPIGEEPTKGKNMKDKNKKLKTNQKTYLYAIVQQKT